MGKGIPTPPRHELVDCLAYLWGYALALRPDTEQIGFTWAKYLLCAEGRIATPAPDLSREQRNALRAASLTLVNIVPNPDEHGIIPDDEPRRLPLLIADIEQLACQLSDFRDPDLAAILLDVARLADVLRLLPPPLFARPSPFGGGDEDPGSPNAT